ncbi:MAG TPA: peptidylprolyl isomerase [Poseidonia sp.]|nr:peptidylprolyl isomerase [Poseidonia sp.]
MQVLMETSAGNITIDLFHGSAPDTVANFVKLVNMGHYNGLHFHRVIEDFMIQGGCPHSKDPMHRRAGTGGPGWQIPCEPSALALKHDKPGVLSMANAGRNTGGSQFFLTTVATPWLNGNHAVFGEVSEGMDIVKAIEACKKLPGDRPAQPQQIIRCSVIES